MAVELLTKKSTGYYRGCGCGQKVGDLMTPPAGSTDVIITKTGPVTGPVTGIQYSIHPNTIAIDIDWNDAKAFREQGIVQEPRPGMKGVLTRAT